MVRPDTTRANSPVIEPIQSVAAPKSVCLVVCCNVLQYVSSVLQCVRSVLLLRRGRSRCSALQCVAVNCIVLQCVSSMLQRATLSLRMEPIQCIAVCCSILQCVAVCW